MTSNAADQSLDGPATAGASAQAVRMPSLGAALELNPAVANPTTISPASPASPTTGPATSPTSAAPTISVGAEQPEIGDVPMDGDVQMNTTAAADGAASSIPVGDLPGWRQIFTDDFATNVTVGSFPTTVAGKWSAYPFPWKDTSGFGTYVPARVVSVANGVLTKNIRTDAGTPSVAALVPQVPGSSQHGILYGRFAARFRSDSLPGYKVAWLLWPDSGDHVGDGEIDFPETNLDKPTIWGFMHRTNAADTSDKATFSVPANMNDWHNVVIEWSPNLVVFTLDGVEVGRTSLRVPDTAMHWVLQTETAMDIVSPPSSMVSGNVQVDWVSVWAYDPTTADTTAPAVTWTAPGAGANVSGTAAPLAVSATDAKGVLGVQFKVDGVNLGAEDTIAPYQVPWNTLFVGNGTHTISAEARDNAGNVGVTAARSVVVQNVADTTAPTFKTTPCLSGCTVFPQDKANVLVVFNESVVGVSGSTFTLANKNTGAIVPAVVSYSLTANAATATLDPGVVLLADTKYTATVTSGIKDLSGNAITTTSWTFLTGPRPTTSVSPANGATGISRTVNVVVTFDEPIQGVSANFVVKNASGVVVPATITYNSSTFTATLDPTSSFTQYGVYTATLTSAIKDIAGNAISPVTWTFTTGA